MMNARLENMKNVVDPKWSQFGRKRNPDTGDDAGKMMIGDRSNVLPGSPLIT